MNLAKLRRHLEEIDWALTSDGNGRIPESRISHARDEARKAVLLLVHESHHPVEPV